MKHRLGGGRLNKWTVYLSELYDIKKSRIYIIGYPEKRGRQGKREKNSGNDTKTFTDLGKYKLIDTGTSKNQKQSKPQTSIRTHIHRFRNALIERKF